jgi:hypothetical protein
MVPRCTFAADRIEAKYQGEEITIWNRLTVKQTHELRHGEVEQHHRVLAGDGSTGDVPEYITPEMNRKLRRVDVYPAPMKELDPNDDEVTIK